MAVSINFLSMLVLFMLSALAIAQPELLAPSCPNVSTALAPCLNFLKKSADSPSPACCAGAKSIANQVKSKADRQAVCECLKDALGKVGPYDPNRVPQIPKQCGVDISIPPIDGKTDCSKAMSSFIP